MKVSNLGQSFYSAVTTVGVLLWFRDWICVYSGFSYKGRLLVFIFFCLGKEKCNESVDRSLFEFCIEPHRIDPNCQIKKQGLPPLTPFYHSSPAASKSTFVVDQNAANKLSIIYIQNERRLD